MIKIAIRIDDITDDMDWERFDRFTALLDKYEVAPLIGVIPDNQDDSIKGTVRTDYREWLCQRMAKGWVMAMHGYNHKYVTKKGGLFPLNLFSEYAGICYEEQSRMICEGRKMLQELGVETSIFMAPAHTFDKNTIHALKENGFTHITDGFGFEPFKRLGLIWLPISFKRSSDINRESGYTTLVYHVWGMKDKDFDDFENLLRTRREQIIDYSELLEAGVLNQSGFSAFIQFIKATAKRILVKIKG